MIRLLTSLLFLPKGYKVRPGDIALGIAMGLLVLVIGGTARHQFPVLISCYLALFGLYGLAYWRAGKGAGDFYLRLGVWLRLLLLLATPALSDDFYRFIWDGRMWLAGYHPLSQTPLQFLEAGHGQAGLDWSLFAKLNSKVNHTVYPPVVQLIFIISCLIPAGGEWLAAVIMRLFLLAAEVGNIYLLQRIFTRLNIPAHRAVLYALNPLLIIEITGNLHHEGLMIFFLLWAYSEWQQGRLMRSSAAFTLAVATKLLPLLFVPFMVRRMNAANNARYWGLALILSAILFAPMLSGAFSGSHFGESLQLYFKQFAFNGSLYKIATWMAHERTGYYQGNVVGPTLGLCGALMIVVVALWDKNRDLRALPGQWLAAILIYLLFAAIVHPWYLSLPVVLCLFTSWRFPIIWSGVAFLSYIHYTYEPFRDNNWLVALEYGITFAFFITESLLLQNVASKA